MKSFSNRLAEDRRLLMLKLLERSSDYCANEELLQSALSDLGHHVSHDLLRSDLAWLEEQGLIVLEQIASIAIAHATRRGIEAASGVAAIPGVKRPAPEE